MTTPTLTDHQWSGVRAVADWFADVDTSRYFDSDTGGYFGGLSRGQDFFLGGFAGSGKTTITPALIDKCGLTPNEVAFVAPTGKAAKVLGQKLRAFDINETPTTIHGLIYEPLRTSKDALANRLHVLKNHLLAMQTDRVEGVFCSWDPAIFDLTEAQVKVRIKEVRFELKRAMNEDGMAFAMKPREAIRSDIRLILCDEASMVGRGCANDLALLGIPILAIGDPGQLPPVQEKYGFNVARPDAFLTEIHRQAKDNPIIHLATLAREGRELPYGDYGNGVKVVNNRDDDVTLDLDREVMALSGTHKKRWALTSKIRKALGLTQTGPAAGEPLICRKNSQKHVGMVNGGLFTNLEDTGNLLRGEASFPLRVQDDDTNTVYDVESVQCLFEEHVFRKKGEFSGDAHEVYNARGRNEQFDFGHVLTVHSAQGSQWDDVALHNEANVFREESARWLYTGLTRAAKTLTVIQ